MDQGALELLNAQISASVMALTGMVSPDGAQPARDGDGVTSAGGSDVTSAGSAQEESGVMPGVAPSGDAVNQLVQRAYGANLAQRRVPDSD
jgi:hypothetical protein